MGHIGYTEATAPNVAGSIRIEVLFEALARCSRLGSLIVFGQGQPPARHGIRGEVRQTQKQGQTGQSTARDGLSGHETGYGSSSFCGPLRALPCM